MPDLNAALERAAAELALRRIPPGLAGSAPVRRAVRRGDLRRVRWGVYCVDRRLTPSHREQVVAALMMLSGAAIATGTTAARLWSLEGLPTWQPDETIHVLTSAAHRRRLKGCRLHYATALPAVDLPQAVPATTLAATVVDIAAHQPFGAALVVAESAMRRNEAVRDAVRCELSDRPPRYGAAAAERVVRVADIWSESPLESRARALWIEAGLPPPIQQAVVKVGGAFLARVDFLWPEALLVVEVDGFVKYDSATEMRAERRRQNRLIGEGYTVLRFTWADIVGRRDPVIAQIQRCLRVAA